MMRAAFRRCFSSSDMSPPRTVCAAAKRAIGVTAVDKSDCPWRLLGQSYLFRRRRLPCGGWFRGRQSFQEQYLSVKVRLETSNEALETRSRSCMTRWYATVAGPCVSPETNGSGVSVPADRRSASLRSRAATRPPSALSGCRKVSARPLSVPTSPTIPMTDPPALLSSSTAAETDCDRDLGALRQEGTGDREASAARTNQ
jgi:hypothetical protein